jgi:hypothetical protein
MWPSLEQCVNKVGAKDDSVKGHFRHARLTIEDLNILLLVTSLHSAHWWTNTELNKLLLLSLRFRMQIEPQLSEANRYQFGLSHRMGIAT